VRHTTLEGFAGPGGFSEALRMLGATGGLGVELNTDASATAEAAGHRRLQADIRHLDPDDFPDVAMWLSGPPCPTYNASGKRTGIADYGVVLDGLARLGDAQTGALDTHTETYRHVKDQRTALVLETLRWALRLPALRTVIAEQVPSVRFIWENTAAELVMVHDFDTCHVLELRADDYGAATRRRRVFLVATRGHEPDLTGMPIRAWWSCGRYQAPKLHIPTAATPFPVTSMAAALGWPAGVMIRTRGNRRTPGGNLFSADRPAISLTEKARSWIREDTGQKALTAAEAGVLQTFPAGYPWRGSRSSQFARIADAVPPAMAAAVIGAAAGIPWHAAVWRRLGEVYGIGRGTERPGQLDLLAEVA
jgi:DNA (cytosine-5)-methyltransferase 1